MRTIGFERMKFHAPVGVFPEEKTLGNEIEIEMKIHIPNGDVNDKLKETIDYSEIYDVIASVMKEEMDLLETVADRVVEALSQKFTSAQKIWIKVAKLNPPLPARIGKSFIEKDWIRG